MLQESHEGEEFGLPTFEGEQLNFPLAPLTSWHIGGQAERFYLPVSVEALSHYVAQLPQGTKLTWLGLGSNVLIRDHGISGAVICTRKCQEMTQREDGTLYVQAGATCAKFARFATKLGYSDAAFFAGIPGTIGGALAMNAGAFGGETWEWVQSVTVMSREGVSIERQPNEYDIAYRSVHAKQPMQDEAFMAAVFRFPQGGMEGMTKIRELLKKRSQTQPIGTFNCGSVYRNPPGDFAARLIEACGLKGYRVGDAIVSEKHANFIINCNHASAKDVETLMSTIESAVWASFNIKLQAEVRILG